MCAVAAERVGISKVQKVINDCLLTDDVVHGHVKQGERKFQ